MSVVAQSAGFPASLQPKRFWLFRSPAGRGWCATENKFEALRFCKDLIDFSAETENLAVEQAKAFFTCYED
jgi:hypothetical protein